MDLFWQEYIFYVVSIFSLIVSVSSSILFLYALKKEKKLHTPWRAFGFFLLAVSFFMLIIERIYPAIGILALTLFFVGFYCIYRGVLLEPSLISLARVGTSKTKKTANFDWATLMKSLTSFFRNIYYLVASASQSLVKEARGLGEKSIKTGQSGALTFTFILAVVIFLFVYIFFSQFAPATLALLTLVFIVTTIQIQIRRYQSEKKLSAATRNQNLWPLLGYVFLAVSTFFLLLNRLPDLDIVFLFYQTQSFSWAFYLSVIGSMVGFIFLAVWSWNFIKLRVFLRTYVVFLFLTIIISSLGSLVFTLRIFSVVEENNLSLMAQGAQAENYVMTEKADNALFVARTLANDPRVTADFSQVDQIKAVADEYYTSASLDIMRIYNKFGEVVLSPHDERDIGRLFSDDKMISYVLSEKSQIKTFDQEAGVLAPVIVARGIYPVIINGSIEGAIEAAYRMDTAFVDYSKERTGLDVTIYTDSTRSATTITTQDEVSRWVGTQETDTNVLSDVLQKGELYTTRLDRLGIEYYSAFLPIRNTDGQIIGIVSVGTPTYILFENTRTQLVTTFLIGALISLLVAFVGYIAIRSFEE